MATELRAMQYDNLYTPTLRSFETKKKKYIYAKIKPFLSIQLSGKLCVAKAEYSGFIIKLLA